ncbi:MAG: hypothetical protein IMZ53_07255 [Thermoplasmata archaeon]|nr:hypothetical protein [Thermoplasmata archaeon]MBE3140362.1 hypothetical protein [Thermoplasmata archaeon]
MAVKSEVIEKIAALMTAAFGLIAALAWNEAIGGLFKQGGALYFLAAYGVWAYAIFVTILAVVMTIWIGRVAAKMK